MNQEEELLKRKSKVTFHVEFHINKDATSFFLKRPLEIETDKKHTTKMSMLIALLLNLSIYLAYV